MLIMLISSIFVPIIEIVEELRIWVCFSFFLFVFHAKSGTTNNHRKGSSDISYQSLFSRDSNGIENFEFFFTLEKNRSEIFDLTSS